jgi:hypothetical protein
MKAKSKYFKKAMKRERKVNWGFDHAKGLTKWFEGNHDHPTANTWDNGPLNAASKEPVREHQLLALCCRFRSKMWQSI